MPDHVLNPPESPAVLASTLLRAGFSVDTDSHDGEVVVRLQGELDMATTPALSRAVDAVMDGRPHSLALDLSELTFVDSTGIRILITACRRAGAQGCSFVLCSPQRAVLKALRLTGMDRLMVIEPGPPDR